MTDFDFTASAELYPAKGRGQRRQHVSYIRFDNAADAIRYAIEDLEPPLLIGAVLEVDEQRFDGVAIRNLYSSDLYPLERGVPREHAEPPAKIPTSPRA